MPPSGFNERAIRGLLEFVLENYKDLQKEVVEGKHPSADAAINFEIKNLERALQKLHVTPDGDIVER